MDQHFILLRWKNAVFMRDWKRGLKVRQKLNGTPRFLIIRADCIGIPSVIHVGFWVSVIWIQLAELLSYLCSDIDSSCGAHFFKLCDADLWQAWMTFDNHQKQTVVLSVWYACNQVKVKSVITITESRQKNVMVHHVKSSCKL